MHLPDIIGFVTLTEKFALSNLIGDTKTLGALAPVYKTIYDEYISTSDDVPLYRDTRPIFMVYFDWLQMRNVSHSLGVEIRIQLTEAQTDSVGPVGVTRDLRGGNLQFLVTGGHFDDEVLVSEVFRIAQFYADKYGSRNARQILSDTPDIKLGLEDKLHSQQFTAINGYIKEIMSKLIPHVDFSSGDYYTIFLQRVRSLQFFAPTIVNVRFAPIDRATVPDPSLAITPYGLVVSIPFTFEQIK